MTITLHHLQLVLENDRESFYTSIMDVFNVNEDTEHLDGLFDHVSVAIESNMRTINIVHNNIRTGNIDYTIQNIIDMINRDIENYI